MAKMIDKKPEYDGEGKVWDCFASNLPQHFVVYNTRSVKGWEFDFCIMAENIGLFVIEVKGWKASSIFNVINEDAIMLSEEEEPKSSPRKQARAYRFNLVNLFKQEMGMNPLVMDLVCYPFILKEEYKDKQLDIVSDETETIFAEELSDPTLLLQKLTARYNINKSTPHDDLNAKRFALIRHHFEPNYDLEDDVEDLNPGYSRLRVLTSEVDDEKADEITAEYFRGIKEVIFVCSVSTLNNIFIRIKNEFEKRKIYPKGNNIAVGVNDGEEPKSGLRNTVSIFNFEVYVINGLSDFVTQDLLIEEGRCTSEEDTLLLKLAEVSDFNYQQFQVEHSPSDQNILVTAGAGTGKTYSMVSRIAYLCNRTTDSVADIVSDIAMITFTNDAADNMKKRLKRLFMNYFILTSNEKYLHLIEDMGQIQISTIHKFAISLLQKACLRLGLGYDCQISSETYNRQQLYHSYLNEFLQNKTDENSDFVFQLSVPSYQLEEMLINFSDQLYDRSIDVKNISTKELGNAIGTMPYFNELIEEVVIPAEREYADSITSNNMIDLRQCMIQINSLVKSQDLCRQDLRYKYVFVDEFQDTDDVQIETILHLKSIFGNESHLFVVGDLKQSIYRFRGATLSAFDKVKQNSGEWIEYSLNRNYRTDRRLLEKFDSTFLKLGAEKLLPYEKKDCLSSRIKKNYDDSLLVRCIQTHGKNQDEFYDDLFKEVKFQMGQVNSLQAKNNLSLEEKTIAILVRYNWQIANIVKQSEKYGIQIQITEGGDLYRLPSTIDLYKLVLAITHSQNEVYLTNLIKSNYVSIKMNLSLLHGLGHEEKVAELVRVLDEYFILMLGKTWGQLVADFQSSPVLVVLREIYEATKPWNAYSGNKEMQVSYRENYECLIEKILQKYSRDFMTLNMVKEFLKINITTYQEEASRNKVEVCDSVNVICTTVHKSKGLEYGTVIIPYSNEDISKLKGHGLCVNMIDGKLSYSLSVTNQKAEYSDGFNVETETSEQEQEESRILYVAMTRAIRNFVWLKDLDSNIQTSWGEFLEVME